MEPTLQALIENVRAAAAAGTPLRIRGGGTKDFLGQALQGELLDTRPLSGIVSHEPTELVVTVRAGTPLAELEAQLAAHGQSLPFEPPHFGTGATVGGMVAAGLNGPARAAVGAVRDYVLGVTLVNGRGELLTFGGQVMKNVAGYDVSRLMAGALGTLGLLVEVSLKVLPVAPAEATLAFEFDETDARERLNRWAGQPLPLNASCWHDGRLLVRLRGAQAAVAAARKTLGGQVFEGGQGAGQWAMLREQTHPFFVCQPGEVLWRLAVPDTAPSLGLGPTLLEWGGAQRWLRAPQSEAGRIRAAVAQAGGHATLFRGGDGRVPVFHPLPAPLDRLHRDLKKQFDPAGIFNRGRLYPDF